MRGRYGLSRSRVGSSHEDARHARQMLKTGILVKVALGAVLVIATARALSAAR